MIPGWASERPQVPHVGAGIALPRNGPQESATFRDAPFVCGMQKPAWVGTAVTMSTRDNPHTNVESSEPSAATSMDVGGAAPGRLDLDAIKRIASAIRIAGVGPPDEVEKLRRTIEVLGVRAKESS